MDGQDRAADVVVVGAGIAGIACARRLVAAGLSVRLLDKGRGIGGRVATRRVRLAEGAEVCFDHGAQYVTARTDAFGAALAEAVAAGAASVWEGAGAASRFVGQPGMSALPRTLAKGLVVSQQAEVGAVQRDGAGWRLTLATGAVLARHVVITAPAPQAAQLIGADHPLGPALAGVKMDPCLTLMAAFPVGSATGLPPVIAAEDDAPLPWIAQDGTKPGRSFPVETWVAQAGPAWSLRHLEDDADTLRARLLPMLATALGLAPEAALHAATHRWRYARVRRALGAPFLRDATGTLRIGGDWCLGPRVEAAWQSGEAMAADLLTQI